MFNGSDGGYAGYSQPGYSRPEEGYNATTERDINRPKSSWNKPKSTEQPGGLGRPQSSG